jgi:phenylalanyl-tRNA synthetase alpha chain
MTDLEALGHQFDAALAEARTPADLKVVRDRFVGRKQGLISALLKTLGAAPPDERRARGAAINALKDRAEAALAAREAALDADAPAGAVDISLPGRVPPVGRRHPLTIVDPAGRSASLLRTHTSGVQIRYMESNPPPVRVIAPGRVYRRDNFDATHTPMFTQVEGLVVDEGISLGDLKGTLQAFADRFFEGAVRTRLRPSFFPYTEPSAELDVECQGCAGRGCALCKHTGWIEILGCGMVHPAVFEAVGIDAERYTGFAFGVGIERLALRLYAIDDIRMFYENDLRFLEQMAP